MEQFKIYYMCTYNIFYIKKFKEVTRTHRMMMILIILIDIIVSVIVFFLESIIGIIMSKLKK